MRIVYASMPDFSRDHPKIYVHTPYIARFDSCVCMTPSLQKGEFGGFFRSGYLVFFLFFLFPNIHLVWYSTVIVLVQQ